MGRLSGALEGGRRRAVASLVVGVMALLVLVPTTAMSGGEAAKLAAVALGTAAASALVAVVVLPRLRRRSLGTQLAVVAGLPAVGVFLGASVGAHLMFLSDHDAAVLRVVLVAAVASAWASAFLLGDRVSAAGAALAAATRSVGDGGAAPEVPPGTGASRELDALAADLADTTARLAEVRARERALESSRRELIAWVSHDLRTPLAGIRAIAEALEDGVADDAATVARYHTILRVEADRLAELVDDLFELSRAAGGVVKLQMQRVLLADLVSDALAGIAPVASAKGVRLQGGLAGRDGEALVSPPELLRALRNVLENAVRHTPSDGAVVVEAALDGDEAVVSVLDAGGGIPEEHLARIFDAGFRGDLARTPGANGGTGLGLAIARGLVEAHHGSIEVVNEPGGARFTLRVPIAGAARESS